MLKSALAVLMFSIVTIAITDVSLAHHNANYPEGVEPSFNGIDLYSYHNDAIDYSLEMQGGPNIQTVTQDGTAVQTSTDQAQQSGSLEGGQRDM